MLSQRQAVAGVVLLGCMLLGQVGQAQNLLVSPTRIIFEGSVRTTQVDLINTSDKPATYRVSLIQRRMTETGDIVSAKEPLPGELFATGLVRVMPSQIILRPHEDQLVRLQLRLPADLPPGEYRSHLQFNGVPDQVAPADGAAPPAEGLGIKLTPIYGVSIPVIIRHGDLSAQVKLADLKYTPSTATAGPSLAFSIQRTGTCSVYGDLVISLRTADGKSQQVGRVNGVAVYCPNAVRRAIVQLNIPPGTVTAGGSILIGYFRQDDSHAAPWDQQTINLEQ
jgi:hypothetical protein